MNAGQSGFTYRRIAGDSETVRRALVDREATAGEPFSASDFGPSPWLLTTGDERQLIERLRSRAESLDEVTAQIFQGLITSADPVYMLEDRGWKGSQRLVFSRATNREMALEPELLHPIASGSDVDPYSFCPLTQLILFPYRRRSDGEMELVPWRAIEELPATAAYLVENEETLRRRERGKMDRDGWYGYVYPKNLGAHGLPKLGVAATVTNLEVALDASGSTYFHNVRVNGILPAVDGPTLWTLLVLLNSDPLDLVFRRGASEHANGYYAANKQFIAPLPIRMPDTGGSQEIDALGQRLHATASAIGTERHGFLTWLGDLIGARVRDLSGRTQIAAYNERTVADLVDVLVRNQARLAVDPTSRALHDALADAHAESRTKLGELGVALERDRREAEVRVADLYELTSAQRALMAEDSPERR